MSFKFPFTNYHELNLTWVLEQLKKLFEESEENVETIEGYEDRLSAVETEVTDLESTTTQAINTANAAATNAATALSRANTANQNALTASSQAGAAVTAAQESQQEAQAATQAAQQAQATAMTFDGRITQAQNDASAAVHEAESFENRVNAAINTANNAANTATIAQGIAVNANQTAAQALDELNAQRDELEAIAAGLIDDINDEADAEKQDIQNLADSVIASIPSDYTQLSADVKNKAPLIMANASGEIASFKDGADDMEIRHLFATINPIQAGTGVPSPSNVRPISGRTSLSGKRTGKNLLPNTVASLKDMNRTGVWNGNTYNLNGVTFNILTNQNNEVVGIKITTSGAERTTFFIVGRKLTEEFIKAGYTYILSGCPSGGGDSTYRLQISDDVTTTRVDTGSSVSVTPTDAFAANNYNAAIRVASGYVGSNVMFYPMLRLEDTENAFEPYQGATISVNWQTEAGTVYGGTLDVITGELTVNMTLIDLGSLAWNRTTSYSHPVFYTNISSAALSNNQICSVFKNVGMTSGAGNFSNIEIDCSFSKCFTNNHLFARYDYYTTAEDFKAAVTGQTLVYELATPQTVQLDPVTVKTLLGYNTIFTDCGPVSVDYPADTKLYIDGKFAELQALVLEN